MKKAKINFKSIVFFLLVCLSFNSCSSFKIGQLEKRHYRGGYYFDRSTTKVSETNRSVNYESINTKQEELSTNNTEKITSPSTLLIPISSELNKVNVENENSIAAHVNTAQMDSAAFFAKHTSSPYSYIKVAPSDANNKPGPNEGKHMGLYLACTFGFIFIGVGLLFKVDANDPLKSKAQVAEANKTATNFMIFGAILIFIGVVGDLIHTKNVKKRQAIQQEQEQNAQWQNQLAEAKYQKEKKTRDSLAIAKFEIQAKEYREMTVKPSLSEDGRKYMVQAGALTKEKKYEEALEYYAKANGTDPTFPQLHYNVALVLEMLERYEQAIYEMKKFTMLVPDGDKNRSAKDLIYSWEIKVKK